MSLSAKRSFIRNSVKTSAPGLRPSGTSRPEFWIWSRRHYATHSKEWADRSRYDMHSRAAGPGASPRSTGWFTELPRRGSIFCRRGTTTNRNLLVGRFERQFAPAAEAPIQARPWRSPDPGSTSPRCLSPGTRPPHRRAPGCRRIPWCAPCSHLSAAVAATGNRPFHSLRLL
jgi:hypothetical protein